MACAVMSGKLALPADDFLCHCCFLLRLQCNYGEHGPVLFLLFHRWENRGSPDQRVSSVLCFHRCSFPVALLFNHLPQSAQWCFTINVFWFLKLLEHSKSDYDFWVTLLFLVTKESSKIMSFIIKTLDRIIQSLDIFKHIYSCVSEYLVAHVQILYLL